MANELEIWLFWISETVGCHCICYCAPEVLLAVTPQNFHCLIQMHLFMANEFEIWLFWISETVDCHCICNSAPEVLLAVKPQKFHCLIQIQYVHFVYCTAAITTRVLRARLSPSIKATLDMQTWSAVLLNRLVLYIKQTTSSTVAVRLIAITKTFLSWMRNLMSAKEN